MNQLLYNYHMSDYRSELWQFNVFLHSRTMHIIYYNDTKFYTIIKKLQIEMNLKIVL